MFSKSNTVTDFESVTLEEITMRGSYVYEIICREDTAEVSLYDIRYIDNEDKKFLRQRSVCSAAEITELLESCEVPSWDGFYGSHPKGVLDGKMFRFSASINGGRTISASGSENFPRHYRDLTNALYTILRRSEEQDNK